MTAFYRTDDRGLGPCRGWAVIAVAVLAVAVLAVSAPALAQGSPGAGESAPDLLDVTGGSHKPGIDALNQSGLFTGTLCGEERFCPREDMKRWVMAVWLVRALDGQEPPAVEDPRFDDVNSDAWWLPHAERLAELGVTAGCKTEPLRFCPDEPVTRAQMATLLVRAFNLDPAQPAGFEDTHDNTHADTIDALAAAGVTAGCTTDPLNYCPRKPVTRAQMATFLARALGLIDKPEPSPAPLQELVAFSTSDGHVYVMNTDGSGVRRITDGWLHGWLPDGSILFIRAIESEILAQDLALFSVRADGTQATQIVDSYFRLTDPAVDSAGTHIAFVRGTGETLFQGNLFVVGTDGSNLMQLTDSESSITDVEWSPDGQRIAFTSNDGVNGGLFVIDADGSELQQLTQGEGDDVQPSWSPDGGRITFASHDGTDYEIFVVNADGSGLQQLTDNDVSDLRPSWSPDGTWIAFNGERHDASTAALDSEIFAISPDGENLRQLTDDALDNYFYEWSPDGMYLAAADLRIVGDWQRANDVCVMNFSSQACYPGQRPVWLPSGTHILFAGFIDGTVEIFLMAADGSGVRRLTNNDIHEEYPQWWSSR